MGGIAALVAADRGKLGRGWKVVGFLALAGAPLAKENGLAFGLGFGLWVLLFNHKAWKMGVSSWGGAVAAVALKWWAIGRLAPSGIGFIDNPLAFVAAGVRVLNGGVNLLRYACLWVFPRPLSADYSYDQLPVLLSWWNLPALASWTLVLVLVWGGIWWCRRAPHFVLWAAVCSGALLMVSNILVPTGTLFAERLLYLPGAGACMGCGWVLANKRGLRGGIVLALWLVVAVPLARQRTLDWRDDSTLFASAVQVTPRSARSHYGLGRALQVAGRTEEAIEAYGRAVEIYPRYAEAHYNLGAAHAALERPTQALAAYRRAIEARPGYVQALFAQAVILEMLQRRDEAVRVLDRLIDIAPGHAQARKHLARLMAAAPPIIH